MLGLIPQQKEFESRITSYTVALLSPGLTDATLRLVLKPSLERTFFHGESVYAHFACMASSVGVCTVREVEVEDCRGGGERGAAAALALATCPEDAWAVCSDGSVVVEREMSRKRLPGPLNWSANPSGC